MKTYYKTTIALGVALAFSASNAALAMEKDWKFHEDKWQEVISYGSVPIANESSGEWGPWSEFIQPAAGPAVPFLGQAEGDLYRPIPPLPTPPVIDTCPAGAMCGYAIYKVKGDKVEYRSYSEYGQYNGYYPATFIAYPTFGEPEGWLVKEKVWVKDKHGGHYEYVWVEKGTTGTLDVNFSLAHLNGSNPADPLPVPNESGNLSGHYYLPNSGAGYGNASLDVPYSYHDTEIDGTLTKKAGYQTANGEFAIYAYMNGGSSVKCWSECGSLTSVEGYYIAGYPTALAYMDASRVGNVTARYEGNEILSGARVGINVQFGPGTWDGAWSSSGHYSTYVPAFGANGTITGANIQSTAVNTAANGYQVQGQVQGTFYGAAAQALAGVVDVTFSQKIVPDTRLMVQPDIRHVDLFATQVVVPKPPKPE
ncbi:hypothetical protein SCT_0628 [Sulfuricella sp. T08]|uniref:transferrin-binding protein-like solute binding protein n=1 Tax=Sulfuricella sp. T08 TaxID=1632857 RepID=UPI0006179FCE|nr:transferrin-binding protein-like solute binding protein [Sulfuricella sp. T08]GAO35244.1 hypothetical protein SCT_0628 [Sulfuricella sp. T08]